MTDANATAETTEETADQMPEQPQTQQGPKGFDKVYMTIEDFTALGLLTAEEIEEGEDINRVVSVEHATEPRTATLSIYESKYSPKGIRFEYNRTAEGLDPANDIIKEYTVEGSISNTGPRVPSAWQSLKCLLSGKKFDNSPDRYFGLTVTARLRDADFRTNTVEYLSVNALQDPENPERFIVDFAMNGGRPFTLPAEKIYEVLQTIREKQAYIAGKSALVKEAPDAAVHEVSLPVPRQ